MNILIIGSGGREHAIGLKLYEENKDVKLFFAPGNGGTDFIGENVSININNYLSVLEFCNSEKIDLVVIGPELPLVNGLADDLRAEHINVFGPNKNAARIEGDKSFAKSLMKKYSVPTASYKTFSKNEFTGALSFLKEGKFPIVIKASGLAAGKGVIIAQTLEEAESALDKIMNKSIFGHSGDVVIIEEFLEGQELSVFVVTDGENYVILPPSQDHKKIGENDTGKNTGGMGAYSPVPFVNEELVKEIENKVVKPTLKGLEDNNSKFNGCLYCGLIKTKEGIKVIEFNCRFGDPEIQAVLQLVNGDFLELLNSTSKGNVNKNSVKYNGGSAICVVAASGGYPGKYEKGFEIFGLDSNFDKNIKIIHAGTKKEDKKIITNGGRVLNIVSSLKENDLTRCKTNAYRTLDKVNFNNIYYRKDIAYKAVK